jgi:hypothetical protein
MKIFIKNANKKVVFISWIIIPTLISLLSVLITISFWILFKKDHITWGSKTIYIYLNAVISMPFGMLIANILPWGWINLLGLFLALLYKNTWFLLISIVGSIIFGISWPWLLNALISV